MNLDRASLLIEAAGSSSLGDVEKVAAAHGLTLGFAFDASMTVGAWLAEGPHDSLADPADHVIAGLEATLPSGKPLVVHPGPRRAVGPDLTALVLGARDRFARVTRAWLRVHVVGARRPRAKLPAIDLDPPVNAGEAALLDLLSTQLR